jgi:hypothetical protein
VLENINIFWQMWFIGAILAIALVTTAALLYHELHIVIGFIVLYVLYVRYIDDGPTTGYRTNAALRKWTWLWSRPWLNPLRLVAPAGLTFAPPDAAQYIFVVLPNHTNSALFWTFGVHGGHGWRSVADSLRIAYLLPCVLFYIPLLRELLLATGAVANSEGALQRQINLGRNVAYAPHGMADVLAGSGRVLMPPVELFELVTRTQSLSLVPVVVHEDTPCALLQHPRLHWIQSVTFALFRYPWPCVWFPRRGAGKVHVNLGAPMLGANYQGRADEMMRDFCNAVESIHNTGYDDFEGGWTWQRHEDAAKQE